MECIAEEGPTAWEQTRSRAEAIWELKIPLARYWVQHGAAVNAEEFWQALIALSETNLPQYTDEVVTHFLECARDITGFVPAIAAWRERPKLKAYVTATEDVIGSISFS